MRLDKSTSLAMDALTSSGGSIRSSVSTTTQSSGGAKTVEIWPPVGQRRSSLDPKGQISAQEGGKMEDVKEAILFDAGAALPAGKGNGEPTEQRHRQEAQDVAVDAPLLPSAITCRGDESRKQRNLRVASLAIADITCIALTTYVGARYLISWLSLSSADTIVDAGLETLALVNVCVCVATVLPLLIVLIWLAFGRRGPESWRSHFQLSTALTGFLQLSLAVNNLTIAIAWHYSYSGEVDTLAAQVRDVARRCDGSWTEAADLVWGAWQAFSEDAQCAASQRTFATYIMLAIVRITIVLILSLLLLWTLRRYQNGLRPGSSVEESKQRSIEDTEELEESDPLVGETLRDPLPSPHVHSDEPVGLERRMSLATFLQQSRQWLNPDSIQPPTQAHDAGDDSSDARMSHLAALGISGWFRRAREKTEEDVGSPSSACSSLEEETLLTGSGNKHERGGSQEERRRQARHQAYAARRQQVRHSSITDVEDDLNDFELVEASPGGGVLPSKESRDSDDRHQRRASTSMSLLQHDRKASCNSVEEVLHASPQPTASYIRQLGRLVQILPSIRSGDASSREPSSSSVGGTTQFHSVDESEDYLKATSLHPLLRRDAVLSISQQ